MKEKILDDLISNAKYYDLVGVEFTQEDVNYVLELMNDNHSYDEAIQVCLEGISETLNDWCDEQDDTDWDSIDDYNN